MSDLQQVRWIGSFVGEQVDHFQRAKAPVLGKSEATADGRIVSLRIRRAGVEHNKRYLWMVGGPRTPEGVAIGVCGVEDGPATDIFFSLDYQDTLSIYWHRPFFSLLRGNFYRQYCDINHHPYSEERREGGNARHPVHQRVHCAGESRHHHRNKHV